MKLTGKHKGAIIVSGKREKMKKNNHILLLFIKKKFI
jgi:hypothetical protein